MADRALTTTLSYVLALTITALLAGGLLFAAGNVVGNVEEDVTRDELRIVGQQLSSRLMAADRLARTGADTVRVEYGGPPLVAGSAYTVSVRGGADPELVLNGTSADVSVTVGLPVESDLTETTAPGGDLRIVLTDAGALEVRAA
jgi:hypothetical protein